MQFSLSPILIAVLIATFLTITIAIISWRFRKSTPEAWLLAILMLFVAEWLITYYLELSSLNLDTSIMMAKLQYIGISACPTMLFVFAFAYYKQRRIFSRRVLLMLGIVPTITIALAFTNEAHELIWTQYFTDHGGLVTLSYPQYGVWFWFYIVYSYMLMAVTSFVLVRNAIYTINKNRGQSVALLLAILAPWVGNMLYGLDVSVLQGIDPTPIAFAVSGVMLWVAIIRFHLLNILPAAQEMIIDNMSDGIIIIDNDNRVVDSNFAAAQILDLEAQSLLGKALEEIIGNHPGLKAAARNPSTERSRVDIVRDGESYHYDVVNSPIRNRMGEQTGQVLLLHDITQRVDMLGEIHESWTKEIEAKQALEQEIEARSLFVNVLAHELKTPLTPQMAAIQLLRDTYDKDKQSDEYKLINLVAGGAQALNDTLSDLLDLAAFSNQQLKLNKKSMSLRDTIIQVSDQFSVQVSQLDQSIVLDIPDDLPMIKADINRMKQVLVNLISNAIKFNPAGAEISIRAKVADKDLVVEVQDYGEGISAEKQEAIFKPYHRTEQDRQIFHGLGLGLAISKNIVEAHNGKIWVASEPTKGSTFSFSMMIN